MGQSISSAIESIQNNAEKEKLANDAMNSLIELAKMQVQAFELAVKSQSDVQMVPIDRILEKDNIIQCNISQDPQEIGAMIQDTFSSFVSGDILQGVSKLIGNGLKLLLGSYSGNSSSRDTYAITCGQLGGISRIDMHFYSYRYTSSQLTQVAKQVLCVSIVRSSVDPTKLSDATLRNIVQNTYSASSVEDQQKMYNQLVVARDADLRSRSGGEGGIHTASLLVAARRANAWTRPSRSSINGLRLTAADGAAPKYNTYTKNITARLQINTASANTEPLKNWIYGYLYSEFEQFTVDNGIVVSCEVSAASMSNSEIIGHITLVLSDKIEDAETRFNVKLGDALRGAVSNKCPIPALSYTIDGVGGGDEDVGGDEGTGDIEHPFAGINPEGPWPQLTKTEEQIWPDSYFSDLEEELVPMTVKKRASKSVNGHVSVMSINGPNKYSIQAREKAKRKAAELKLRWNSNWDGGNTIFLEPILDETYDDEVKGFFENWGSHVHVELDGDHVQGYTIIKVCLTIRHPDDRDAKKADLQRDFHLYTNNDLANIVTPPARFKLIVDAWKFAAENGSDFGHPWKKAGMGTYWSVYGIIDGLCKASQEVLEVFTNGEFAQ